MTTPEAPKRRGRPAVAKKTQPPLSQNPDSRDTELAELRAMVAQLSELVTKQSTNPIQADYYDGPAIPEDEIWINFVEDGMTAFGALYYRGQELVLKRDSDEFKSTLDSDGKSWLDLTEREQARKYGKTMFRKGPWQGLSYEDAEDDEGRRIDPDLARKAAELEAQRAGGVKTTRAQGVE